MLLLPLWLGAVATAGAAPPDPRAAQAMAFQCYTCHGTGGRGAGAMRPLAGKDHHFIVEQLRAFRAGTLPATIMDRIAKGFSDEEIIAIADVIAGPPRGGKKP